MAGIVDGQVEQRGFCDALGVGQGAADVDAEAAADEAGDLDARQQLEPRVERVGTLEGELEGGAGSEHGPVVRHDADGRRDPAKSPLGEPVDDADEQARRSGGPGVDVSHAQLTSCPPCL